MNLTCPPEIDQLLAWLTVRLEFLHFTIYQTLCFFHPIADEINVFKIGLLWLR